MLARRPMTPENIRRVVVVEELVFQAESDLRCPAQDNEQLFVALRQLGREVEYVL
jgi:dipeptidyl aminopeptidase/acylaminoacyl peptidase